MEYLTWSSIPEHILVDIFQCLPVNDRLNASLVCKYWSECFHNPKLWSKFLFKFDTEIDNEGQAITCIEKYCNALRDVEIYINQSQKISRDRALQVVDELSLMKKKRLQKFTFNFTGHNPLCFRGQDILDKLKLLFSRREDDEVLLQLTYVDLNHCDIAFDNELILSLAKQHKALKCVRLQNSCLVDNVTPSSIKKLVTSCPLLEELHVFYHYLDKEVVEELCCKRAAKLKDLSLMCNRCDKYKEIIQEETWQKLTESNPDVKVEIHFHQTMPHHLIIPILSPGIPLTRLSLKVYGWLTDELTHVAATFSCTLTYISFNTSLDLRAKAHPGLETALLELVRKCCNLTELHCHCALKQDTVEKIKSLRQLVACTLYATPTD